MKNFRLVPCLTLPYPPFSGETVMEKGFSEAVALLDDHLSSAAKTLNRLTNDGWNIVKATKRFVYLSHPEIHDVTKIEDFARKNLNEGFFCANQLTWEL